MADCTITFARSARKDLERIPPKISDRILDHIQALSTIPRPSGATKLRGSKHLWRIRIGDYRVVYSIDDDAHIVDVALVRHRREAYRDL